MIRKFTIPDGPSVADPAHQIAYWEVLPDGKIVQYTTFEDLKQFIKEIELTDIENDGYNKGINEVLTKIGMSHEEYFKTYFNK